jgi:predicted HAD superfamily Cof-like phosphohydrolase
MNYAVKIAEVLEGATYVSSIDGRERHFKEHHIVGLLAALLPVLAPDMYEDVLDFHRKFRPHHARPLPRVPDLRALALVRSLVQEESEELLAATSELIDAAYVGGETELWALSLVADGAADLIYVIMGLVQACGIDIRPVWREVQKTNMAKEGGDTREDGKIMKPAGWVPPDVFGVLRQQAPIPGTFTGGDDGKGTEELRTV